MTGRRAGAAVGSDVRGARVRLRRAVAVLFGVGAAAVVGWAIIAATAGGFDRIGVAVALAAALVAANLAPVVAVSGGRIDAFTPVGALLVPIGVLLPLPEAVAVYALGETVGVVAAHRFDRHVGGPAENRATRTIFVVGKSIVGAAVGLLALQAVIASGTGVAAVVLASLVGVAVSTGLDRGIVAVTAAAVHGSRLVAELRRGLGGLVLIAASEVVIGALIAVLAQRDAWSLVLGLAAFGLLLFAGSAYARAATEHGHTTALLGLAEDLQQAGTGEEVIEVLLARVRALLPEDEVAVIPRAPDPRDRSWQVSDDPRSPRWLVVPRLVETRDYEQQPLVIVDAAVSLAQIALTRTAAQEQLVEQDRLRALVLATVAHDLRNPLGVAAGGVEVLSTRGELLAADDRDDLLRITARAIARMRRLIDDLLGLELAEERRGPAGPSVDARAVAARVVAEGEGDIRAATVPVIVQPGGPVPVAIDDVGLERVLDNVIGNARRHTPSGGAVRIRFEQDTDTATIVVEDDGPGVPTDERDRIFEPFRQGGGRPGSVGLGLYVARRFSELHGGSIWVHDAPGGGAAFHIRLGRAAELPVAQPSDLPLDVTPAP